MGEAQEAGADPEQIKLAMAEVERMSAANAAKNSGGAEEKTIAQKPQQDPDAVAEEAEKASAAELRSRAEAHKLKGNEKLKANTKTAAREALECFTTGLEVRCSDNVLNAQLYSNRAHVRILLRQWVEAVDDCRKAIDSDPKNMKAYWRAAKASLNLDLCKNGVAFCDAGLRIQPGDTELMKLKSSCVEKLETQQRRKAEMAAASSSQEFNADEAMAVQERVNDLNENAKV